jgi:hypothetical protein
MTDRPTRPEYTPAPGWTLRDIMDALAEEAAANEASAAAWGARWGPKARRRAGCMDAARKIIEAMIPNWDQHKALMQRAQGRKN